MDPEPLVTSIYTADPSAHVFAGKIYVYPSHDRETDIADNDNGDQYDMADYHVLSLDSIFSKAVVHPVALRMEDIPWVSKQVWAPDCAQGADGKYYLYFPARDKEGVFRIGVAVGKRPEGPFVPEEGPIKGSYSIDPASFVDEDGSGYLYFGGLWGGQLQCWEGGDGVGFDKSQEGPKEPSGKGLAALCARVARLRGDMLGFDGEVEKVVILDENSGERIAADDHERRFFEASWMHRYKGKYYFSYSTGDSHYICYAIGSSPMGPFTYAGRILEPVLGWTTHHSIVQFEGRWWLFYHDCSLSGGKNHLRSVKMREIVYDAEGRISLKEKQKEVMVKPPARLE